MQDGQTTRKGKQRAYGMFCCCWKRSTANKKIRLNALLSEVADLNTEKQGKKSQFWETQVEGKREVWDALKVIAESESLDLANAIITSLNLNIAHENYSVEFKVWDEFGDEYIVPAWVYAPSKAQHDETTTIEIIPRDPDTSLRVRLSNGAPDVSIRVHKQDPIYIIIQQLLSNMQDKNASIKLFHLGKLLEVHKKIVDALPIADQEVIVQAMILPKN